MAWTSRYAAQFTRTLKWQLFAIINRDMEAALANVVAQDPAGTYGTLPDIVSYHKGGVAIEQFPSLMLTTERQSFDLEASQQSREYAANFYVALAVAHQDPNAIADLLELYFLALDEVLTSAWELTTADFYDTTIPLPSPPFKAGASSPGLQLGALTSLAIADIAYDEMKSLGRRGFARAGVMSLVCGMKES